MANSFVASRAQLVYAVCLPLAVLLGYFLADPMDSGTVLAVALVIGVLTIPIFIRYYHPLLIFSWNAAIAPFFFPGQAYLWTVLAFISIFFAVVNRFVSAEARFEVVPSIVWSLLFLAATVVVTAWLRGGAGLKSFGAAHYGGKNYFLIIAAIVGYFALTSRRIPEERVGFFNASFFLSGLTALVPNLAYFVGINAVYYLFPAIMVSEQIIGDASIEPYLARLNGLTFASMAFYCWLFGRYGFKGLFDINRPWRAAMFFLACFGCVFTGYRSYMILFILTATIQFCLEGLLRPRVLLVASVSTLLACLVVLPQADKLPLVVQRSISFIPGIPLNPMVKVAVEGSTDWRLRMWSAILPMVPKYLLVGKGYTFDPGEQMLAGESARRHQEQDYGGALYSGDYHNGPLTLIIPLGIWGMVAFLWFLVAAWRYLYRNYRYGPPGLHRINTFLLAYFSARIVYFFFVFGMFPSDFFNFTGVVGLAVALNGAKLARAEETEEAEEEVPEHEELALTFRGTSTP